jgi:phosphatidylglycerol---prolipoprotein diacylglyceryl transferase
MSTLLASVGWPVTPRVLGFSPHGVFIAVGFAIGAWLFGRLAQRRGISVDAVNSIVFWSLIGAIVGARVAYVIAHASDFGSPVEWLEVWKGGISLLGGIAGATIANAINIRRFGLRFFQVADALTAPLALGIAVGRIGDLIIGDHLGKPTSWFLAWVYKGGQLAPPFVCNGTECQAQLQGNHIEVIRRGSTELRAGLDQIATGAGVHQTAMYDMLIAWALFAFLWWFLREPRREGVATLVFAVWYGCARLVEDFLRIDKRFGPLTGSQWTALTVVIVSVLVAALWGVTKRPGPTTPGRRGAPVETTEPTDDATEDAAAAET